MNFSQKEREFIHNILTNNATNYKRSYRSRLRSRVLSKAIVMAQDLEDFQRMFYKEFYHYTRLGFTDEISKYIHIIMQLQKQPVAPPWDRQKDKVKNEEV